MGKVTFMTMMLKIHFQDKIVSQMQFDIETFPQDKLPDDLKKIEPTKPGSNNLSE